MDRERSAPSNVKECWGLGRSLMEQSSFTMASPADLATLRICESENCEFKVLASASVSNTPAVAALISVQQGQSQDTAPATSQDTAPETSQDTVPATSQDTAPATSQDTAPATSQDTVPATSQDTAPATSQDTAPATSQDTAPSTSQDTAPATSQGTAPATRGNWGGNAAEKVRVELDRASDSRQQGAGPLPEYREYKGD